MRTAARTVLLGALLGLGACSTTGHLGLVARGSADPSEILRNGKPFREIGPARGRACRFFALGVLPFGDADVQTAVDRALTKTGGDALLNIATTNSHYGLIPIYHIFSWTCTEVKGTAVKFQ